MKNPKTIKDYVKQNPGQIQEKIDDIIDNFNFERCREVFNFLGKKYIMFLGLSIPDAIVMKQMARQLLREVTFDLANDLQHAISNSGWLTADCEVYELPEKEGENWKNDAKNQVSLTLSCNIESWTGENS